MAAKRDIGVSLHTHIVAVERYLEHLQNLKGPLMCWDGETVEDWSKLNITRTIATWDAIADRYLDCPASSAQRPQVGQTS